MTDGLTGYLLSATQQAAIACLPWVGRGDPMAADAAAVHAMRDVLGRMPAHVRVVIGEGEKDEAPMLHQGEEFGTAPTPAIDLAVDPLEGTKACAAGHDGAVAVLAVSPSETMWSTPGWYMDKLVVGPKAAAAIDISRPIETNLAAIAQALGRKVTDLRAIVLSKPRHHDLIGRLRHQGVTVDLIPDGDVLGTLRVVMPDGDADLLVGVGGAPEGVLSACAVRVMGAGMQARLAPQSPGEAARLSAVGQDPQTVWDVTDLVSSRDCAFVMTGVTRSCLVEGPQPHDAFLHTTSMIISPLHPGVVILGRHDLGSVPELNDALESDVHA